MKSLLPLALLALSAPLAAASSPQHLPGVANEETSIPSGGIKQFHRGNADVLFVLDRTGRWYRVGLNEGCLSTTPRIDSVTFDSGTSSRIDRFTRVLIGEGGGSMELSCRVDSIRRSEAPPQVHAKGQVTLN